MKVTRKTIAEKAGVSVSVVSRSINNSGYVEKNKKEHVLEIANELGYITNPIAMSLQSKRTKQIIFYVKEIYNTVNIDLYEGMKEEANKYDYMVVMSNKVNFEHVQNYMIDGIILPDQVIAEKYTNKIGKNYYLPAVSVSYGESIAFLKSINMVECDLYKGTIKAIKYLKKMGHKKIALMAPYNINSKNIRVIAWKDFMGEMLGEKLHSYFFDLTDEKCFENNETHIEPISFFEKGLEGAEIFLKKKSDATAILFYNDEMALGFAKKANDLGYNIPKDISIMGIDGSFQRKYVSPELTTLSVKPKELGKLCVSKLINIINSNKVSNITKISAEILEGGSVRKITNGN